MAVSIKDIKHLRKMSGAGMMDCKNALNEVDGDFDQALEIIRKKGQLVAAKRSERETSEGCVLAKAIDGYAAMIALKCETDFVAQNADHVKMTQDILDLAIENRCKNIEEVKALPYEGGTIGDKVIERSGICGEKTELDGYNFVEGDTTVAYIHNGNKLATIVALNQPGVDAQVGKDIAMQVAAMNPISLTPETVPAEVLEEEKKVAAEKAREEGKPENLIPRIAEGRIKKFYKEMCLVNQEYVKDSKKTIAQFLDGASKGLTVIDFKRFTLNAE